MLEVPDRHHHVDRIAHELNCTARPLTQRHRRSKGKMGLDVPGRCAGHRDAVQTLVNVVDIFAVDQVRVLRSIEQRMKQHVVEERDARLRERRDIGHVVHRSAYWSLGGTLKRKPTPSEASGPPAYSIFPSVMNS